MPLSGRRILVVEDEYLIAEDLAALLRGAGAEVIGPAASLPKAMRLAGDSEQVDAAVLDINLRGVAVFPLAAELLSRAVPFLFMTGYGENNIPDEYSAVRRCEKPMEVGRIVQELSSLLPKEPVSA